MDYGEVYVNETVIAFWLRGWKQIVFLYMVFSLYYDELDKFQLTNFSSLI